MIPKNIKKLEATINKIIETWGAKMGEVRVYTAGTMNSLENEREAVALANHFVATGFFRASMNLDAIE
jgi:hypothetical protein